MDRWDTWGYIVAIHPFGVDDCIWRILGWFSLSFQQKIFRKNDPYKLFYATLQAMLIGYGLFLLFSATVHPWYLVLLIPFVTILPEKPLLSPWLWFSLTVSLSYLLYIINIGNGYYGRNTSGVWFINLGTDSQKVGF